MTLRPLLVVAGIGNGSGTGAATARLFAKKGFSVALIARTSPHLDNLANDINASTAPDTAVSFPVNSYSYSDITNVFSSIKSRFPPSTYQLRAAVYNAGHAVWKPFLEVTAEDVAASNQANIEGPFAFAHEVISVLKDTPIDEEGVFGGKGKRGTLIFTGATASIRGNVSTSVFAAGKHALRALSQSLGKEFGKQNIHVAHAIIDGGIITDRTRERRNNKDWEQNEDVRLNPDSIATAYLYLAQQDRSAWTWELDLRPAHEKW